MSTSLSSSELPGGRDGLFGASPPGDAPSSSPGVDAPAKKIAQEELENPYSDDPTQRCVWTSEPSVGVEIFNFRERGKFLAPRPLRHRTNPIGRFWQRR